MKTGGSGKTIQCAICHGDELKGLGEALRNPGLQPVYIARQLICIQNGSSAGTAVALMKKAVANLSGTKSNLLISLFNSSHLVISGPHFDEST